MFCAKATTDANASITVVMTSYENGVCVQLVPLDVSAGSVSACRALDEPTELHAYPSGTVLDDDGAHSGRGGGFSDQTKYVAEREQ